VLCKCAVSVLVCGVVLPSTSAPTNAVCEGVTHACLYSTHVSMLVFQACASRQSPCAASHHASTVAQFSTCKAAAVPQQQHINNNKHSQHPWLFRIQKDPLVAEIGFCLYVLSPVSTYKYVKYGMYYSIDAWTIRPGTSLHICHTIHHHESSRLLIILEVSA
jgi:hypothetical protein